MMPGMQAAAVHAAVRETEHSDPRRRAARELGLQPRILVLGRSLVVEQEVL